MTLKVHPWTWRDGTVHLEMTLASFFENNELVTHLDGGNGRLETACGKRFFGVASATGLGHTERVTCEACREILRSAKMELS